MKSKIKIIILTITFITHAVVVNAQNYQHLIMYGQSLSTGQQSWPPLSTTNIPNNYMIGSQVWSNYNNNKTNILSPLIANLAQDGWKDQIKAASSQLSCECPIVGAANYIQTKTGGTNKYIASSCGFGGQTIEQLSKEYYSPTRYNDFTNCISYASNLSANSIHCPAIFWMQGEYNYFTTAIAQTAANGLESGGIATGNKARYKSLMLKLKNNMQNDIQVKYGQTDKPLFITYQVGKQFTTGIDMTISMAQLEASNEYDDIICAGPVYYLPDRGGHLDPNGYRWYGEMLGKVYNITKVNGQDFKPLQPKEISRSATNAKVIIIKYLVPQLPLVLDERITAKCVDYGFEVYLNGTKVTLSSVTINNDNVELTSSVDLNGDIEVVYAGPSNSGKGNLRDSDPAIATTNYLDLDKKVNGVFVYDRDISVTSLHPYTVEPKDANGIIIYDKPYPLFNFSLAFYYKLKAADQTYLVPNISTNPFVNVTGVSLLPTSLSMNVGTNSVIAATVSPNNATDVSLLWISSNPSIATVIDGVVNALKAGTTTISATTVDQLQTASCVITCNSIIGTAYPSGIALAIPDTIQFENYDIGGEGISYHDATSGNSGGVYRSEDIDIQTCTDDGGGYNIYSTSAGEWLKYTVNVPKSQTYTLAVRYANTGGGTAHFEVDGDNLSGNINLPLTYIEGSTVVYQTVYVAVKLMAGIQTIKFTVNAGNGKFNFFTISSPTDTGIILPIGNIDPHFPSYGLKYAISLKNDPTKVLAHYGTATNCVVETYVAGNPNQLFIVTNIGPGTEDYINFKNLGSGFTFNASGAMVTTNGSYDQFPPYGWDLEQDASGNVRFSSFYNRWNYDPGTVNGSFLKYNSINNSLVVVTYNRWNNGMFDRTGYNAHATDFFDFKITSIYDVSANTSAVEASRMILKSGKTYIICLKENVNKVVAFNAFGQMAGVEDYIAGKTNQQFVLEAWVNNAEGFVNFKDNANGLAWENDGKTVTSAPNNAWNGWDLQLDATGNVRFCNFMERWGWTETFGIVGTFLRVSDDKTCVVPVYYNKSLDGGATRDYTAYNALAGMYYDFMIKTPSDYVSTVVKTENAKNSTAFGGLQTIVLNNVSNTNVNIYSVDGRLIKNVKPSESTMQLRISKGIYLVKIDNKTSKVVVL